MARRSIERAAMGAITVGLALWTVAAPRPAEACGGTFCDGGPQPMPVEQTGETILFVLDGDEVEVHIQIQYDPTTKAEQFAWVVPVTALPEFSVGSQQLFADLLVGTVPSYGLGTYFEPCDETFGGDDGCDEGGSGGADDDGGIKLDFSPGPPSQPDVVLHTTVGAFEVFVLDGGTIDGVMQWLGDNGFQQDPAAEPILGEYLDEGHLFVAFRLNTDAEAAEIHPIVLRMPTTEPCVPIRLTRIAAKEDMDIRALFLADGRVSSLNWRHVTLNPLKLDWMGLGANYREVVTMAVDEPGADGHTWVTEYAGGTLDSGVSSSGLLDPAWDAVAFEAADPSSAVQLLLEQHLYGYSFDTGECAPLHPLVGGLVERYLMTPADFPRSYLCDDPAAFAAVVDPLAWDGPAFAADLQTRVIDPAAHAVELLETWPYLTRLYTTISPGEMTDDPMFHPTPGLPDVTDLVKTGTVNNSATVRPASACPTVASSRCSTRKLGPSIAPETMPWVETIEYLPADGAPVVEVDHLAAIQALLDAWNAEHGPPRSPASAACGDETGGNDGTGGGGTSGPGAVDDGVGSCACRSTGGGAGGMGLLGLLGPWGCVDDGGGEPRERGARGYYWVVCDGIGCETMPKAALDAQR